MSPRQLRGPAAALLALLAGASVYPQGVVPLTPPAAKKFDPPPPEVLSQTLALPVVSNKPGAANEMGSFSANGEVVAVRYYPTPGLGEGHLLLWRVSSDQALAKLIDVRRPAVASCVARGGTLSPGGHRMAVVNAEYGSMTGRTPTWENYRLGLWDTATGRRLCYVPLDEFGDYPYVTVSFSPDGSLVVLSANGNLRWYDASSGEELLKRRVRGRPNTWHAGPTFSADGRLLAAVQLPQRPADDEHTLTTIECWDVATGRQHASLPLEGRQGVNEFQLSRDGRLVAYETVTVRSDPRGLSDFELAKAGPRTTYTREFLVREVASGRVVFRRDLGWTGGPGRKTVLSTDGRHLFSIAGEKYELTVWDVAAGEPVRRLGAYLRQIAPVSAAGVLPSWTDITQDGTDITRGGLYVSWDEKKLIGPARPKDGPRPEPAALWQALADDDAKKARRAVLDLAASGERALPVLREHLRPVRADARRVQALLADLESNRFAEREAAMTGIEQLGRLVEPELRALHDKTTSLDTKRRVQALLERIRPPYASPGPLQRLRGIEAAERIGGAAARQLLRELAGGTPGVPETDEAAAALRRVEVTVVPPKP